MEIKDYLLQGQHIRFEKTPSHSGEFRAGQLDTIVFHYTGTPNVNGAVRTLVNPKVKASTHLVIGRDGTIVQLVPFNLIAWHSGRSSHNGRVSLNNYSIGIDLVNVGLLTKSGNTYRSEYGTEINPKEVVQAVHRNQAEPRFWQAYSSEQIETAIEITRLLTDTYNIKHIVGHEEISPREKIDPGPAFPLDKIRQSVLAENRDSDDSDDYMAGRVMVKKLNIRSSPSTQGGLASAPLEQGTKVKVLEEANGWYKVQIETEVEGWVASKFLEND